MQRCARWSPVLLVATAMGCAAPQLQQHQTAAAPALSALRQGAFDEALARADQRIASDRTNPYARLVRAVVRYKNTMHQLSLDVRTAVIGGIEAGGLNHRYIRSALEQAESELGLVEQDLAEVASHRGIALELCIACWEIDWNGNGRIDRRDRLLMQIEQDAEGHEVPEGDPRRKPTFRFDDGDIAWARAFVSFQRAALDVVLAYDWTGLDGWVSGRGRDMPARLVLKLAHRERIEAAHARVMEGLGHSDECRKLYLSEADDDREWVPNPRQRNHPMPLEVDDALYETWEGVVGDLRRLMRGQEGLSVAELAQLGDHTWEHPPRGYVDIGRMFSHPKDIVVEVRQLEALERSHDVEGMLSSILGEYYRKDMKRSPLPSRVRRMKGEVDRGEERLERKLRYLFWIN